MHSTDNLNDGYLGSGTRLHHSIKKYGKENHCREILGEMFPDRESLRLREAEIVNDHALKDPMCMNLILGGSADLEDGIEKTRQKRIGKKPSEETKLKISNTLKGKKHTPERRKNISEAHKGLTSSMKGKKHSEEARRKMSVSRRKWRFTDEQKKRRSEAILGENNPFFGKKHTEESKLRMSVAHMGKKHTEESKAKISRKLKGRKRDKSNKL